MEKIVIKGTFICFYLCEFVDISQPLKLACGRKPSFSISAKTKPNQTKSNQIKPKQTKSNQIKQNKTKSNQTKLNQIKSNQNLFKLNYIGPIWSLMVRLDLVLDGLDLPFLWTGGAIKFEQGPTNIVWYTTLNLTQQCLG